MTNDFSGGLRRLRPPATFLQPVGLRMVLQAAARTVQRQGASGNCGQHSPLQLTPAGTEGFKKAEVTVGGVSTAELSSQTMEATRVPGLYFIGEVVDVTGQLGGYNFQWAWASAFAAGQVV